MTKSFIVCLLLLLAACTVAGQADAHRRASSMGIGMNLSYLDNYWLGTREKHFSDFAKPDEAAKREKMLSDIAKAGFKTVRIPICFGAWASIKPPYRWERPEGLETADN